MTKVGENKCEKQQVCMGESMCLYMEKEGKVLAGV